MTKFFWGFLFCAVIAAIPAAATELVYQPVNPSFGGYVGNGQFLMNQAEAQSKHKEKIQTKDQLTTFTENLERRILMYLSSKVVEKMFSGSELTPGRHEIGDFILDVSSAGDGGLSVLITEVSTGNTTTIEIPAI